MSTDHPPKPMKAGGKAHPSGEPAEPLPPQPSSLFILRPLRALSSTLSLGADTRCGLRLQTAPLHPVRSSGRRPYRFDQFQAGKIQVFPGAPSWNGDGISKERPAPLLGTFWRRQGLGKDVEGLTRSA